MERRRDREREIQAAVAEIRLAARADLFPSSDFPPPAPGSKLNRLYERTLEGRRETGRYVVKQGTGVCFMPEDLHSIHIFPAHADIREAR